MVFAGGRRLCRAHPYARAGCHGNPDGHALGVNAVSHGHRGRDDNPAHRGRDAHSAGGVDYRNFTNGDSAADSDTTPDSDAVSNGAG